jgi:hypothetical protein
MNQKSEESYTKMGFELKKQKKPEKERRFCLINT